jgi:hypothetical protein
MFTRNFTTPSLTVLVFALTLFLSSGQWAVAGEMHANPMTRLVMESKAAEKTAMELESMLRQKRFDSSVVSEKVNELTARLDELKGLAESLEAERQFSGGQQTQWERIKVALHVKDSLLSEKKELLADTQKNRNTLRLYARGVMQRAKIVQESASRLAS